MNAKRREAEGMRDGACNNKSNHKRDLFSDVARINKHTQKEHSGICFK